MEHFSQRLSRQPDESKCPRCASVMCYNRAMKKDNLTDVVENLPKVPPQTEKPADRPQTQVISNEGETITLGQKKSK